MYKALPQSVICPCFSLFTYDVVHYFFSTLVVKLTVGFPYSVFYTNRQYLHIWMYWYVNYSRIFKTIRYELCIGTSLLFTHSSTVILSTSSSSPISYVPYFNTSRNSTLFGCQPFLGFTLNFSECNIEIFGFIVRT